MNPERLINIIAMVAIFGLVFSVWCICILLWCGQYITGLKSVQKRLGIVKKETGESQTLRLWRESQQQTEKVGLEGKLTFTESMERLRYTAGWRAPAQTVILGVIGVALLGLVFTYLFGGGITLGIGVFVAILVVFASYTRARITKHAALFEKQLVDALGIAARALRAGLPLLGAFQLISEEIEKPLGDIFFRICQEQMLGLDLRDSIRKVAKTVYNPELKLFATAVAIQLKSGGNLADLMDSLASVIRVRMRLNRRARILIAQTQLSKKVLIALPIVLFFLLTIVAPTYTETFFATAEGKYMLMAAVVIVSVGAMVMNRLAVLRF